MSLIEVNSLEKIYNSNGIAVHALRGIDLQIDKGEFCVIAGPSGSGKTTLLNQIGTLDVPNKGNIIINNEDMSSKSKKELSDFRLNNLGFVFQAYNLIPVLTAMENIEFAMLLKKVPEKVRRQKVMSLMEKLDIAHLADKRPNEMSGGQQQRVAVARAIVNEPLIVLADEPTANLDTKTGDTLLDIMQRMNEEMNITFLFSSHDSQVMSRASRLLLLQDGLILDDRRK